MTSSIIPLAHPEIVKLTASGRVDWNQRFAHKCGQDDLLTVDKVTSDLFGTTYNIRMIGRTDSMWFQAFECIGMQWLGGNCWEEIK